VKHRGDRVRNPGGEMQMMIDVFFQQKAQEFRDQKRSPNRDQERQDAAQSNAEGADCELMLRAIYLPPSGQIPAYEWNCSDVNPPVHAWATIFLHRTEESLRGEGDLAFLKRAFGKLMLNFNWRVNRKDRPNGDVWIADAVKAATSI